jgi:hypothetical protein
MTARATTVPPMGERVEGLDWSGVAVGLDRAGCAIAGTLLTRSECKETVSLYDQDDRFRATIDMARYHFGEGQYRYFAHPLPDIIATLREALWPHLLPIARDWATRLGRPAPWPDELNQWLALCHQAGQTRPTPLLLRYREGDWNALHRDIYGELVFPLQVVIGLDRPCQDYMGGEFIVVAQRPRAQSRAVATTIESGQALIFATRDRPVRSARGWATAAMRHGVSPLRSGKRHALGLVFHDAT